MAQITSPIIAAMQSLRSARLLARLVLAWFVLAMGVAVAAPMVQPRGLDFVCVGTGLKLVQTGADGQSAVVPGGLDCPLCSTAIAPPPAAIVPALRIAAHEAVPIAVHEERRTAALSAPVARGPPAHVNA